MRGLSLRARATVLGTLTITALLVVGGTLLVLTLDQRLTDAADRVARSRVHDLLDAAGAGNLTTTLRSVDDNGMAQVVTADGRVLAATANLGHASAVAPPASADTVRVATVRAPDDQETETYRVWSAATSTPDGQVTAFVGTTHESVDEATAQLRTTLALGAPVVVAAVGVVLWLLLGRTLGRLERIRVQVDDFAPEELGARVVSDRGGRLDEVGRLAATMNGLLERLDVAARRQRDFVADVSHDLQTPLAAQRVALELALARPEAVDPEVLRGDVLAATGEMERLVGDLLVLASLDAGLEPEPTLLDLDEIVLEEARRARLGTSVLLDTSEVSGAPAYAAPDDVRRIVRNLLANAIAHASSQVRLTVGERVGAPFLDVADDGPGVPAQHRESVFDRFHRADRSRPRGGHGLGLPIARGLAERNGGSVDLVDGDEGATFRLVLCSQVTCRFADAPSEA